MTKSIKVGLYSIGLETYWPQFEGLYDRLLDYQSQIKTKLTRPSIEVVDLGMIDNPEKAQVAAKILQEKDVELISLYVSTYALSSTVLPVVKKLNKPVVVLNLQPVSAINYSQFNSLGDRTRMTGE